MTDGIECKFRCRCGEKVFLVRYREKDEDIVTWMESAVRPAMGEAHTRLSPLCPSPTCDLMLPISEASQGIGMRVQH